MTDILHSVLKKDQLSEMKLYFCPLEVPSGQIMFSMTAARV